METQKNALLRKFHSLLSRAGINSFEKGEMLAAYGVESSKDLSVYELTELCVKLDNRANPVASEANRWRKRVIAAIGGYLREIDEEQDIDKIKAIACRAAKQTDFNRIGVDRLRSIYNAFTKRAKDLRFVTDYARQVIERGIDVTLN